MKKRFVFMLLILVALFVVGCGQAPAEEEGEKLQLRLAHSWPARVDPAVGADFIALTMHTNIYDTLVFPTVDGGLEPWVAESWEVSDDNLTYTFHLREGIKFHDGSELQASDVVFSYNRLQTVGQGMAYLFGDRVASVEARMGHGWSQPLREAAYGFFARWLQDRRTGEPIPDALPEAERTIVRAKA